MIPLPRMTYNEVGQTFILLGRAENSLAFGKVVATLHFKVKEIDPSTGAQPGLLRAAPCLAPGTQTDLGSAGVDAGEAEEDGYNDEYQLEDFEVSAADYIKSEPVSNFRQAWEELGQESEMTDDYGLGQRESLQEAVEAVTGILGMAACEGTDAVPPNARSHTLLLAGSLIGSAQVSLVLRSVARAAKVATPREQGLMSLLRPGRREAQLWDRCHEECRHEADRAVEQPGAQRSHPPDHPVSMRRRLSQGFRSSPDHVLQLGFLLARVSDLCFASSRQPVYRASP